MTARAAARRYAKALFDVALQEADVQTVGDALDGFAALVRTNEPLAHVFANPAVPAAKKRAIAEALLSRGGSMPPPVAKLLLLLAERDRLVLLPELAAAYRERVLDYQGIMRGTVTTAVALDADKIKALEQGLGKATGRTVVLDPRVDPAIIGGAITRLGSAVYDGSVVTQLEKMKQALVEGAQ